MSENIAPVLSNPNITTPKSYSTKKVKKINHFHHFQLKKNKKYLNTKLYKLY